ncbi:glycosyltransferase family 4 protein [Flavobacterium sp. TAB 87]|uniref:glycosyltransferase family 4 protein n=1 Tax=Flavobacterium sp. TAB 87 TaxID=1729581 RepID=UPI00076D3851|nr:glycosyltransferase family 4 protein [Flavobacterium sp. TAB 87]KVV15878.1 Glycosyltransferase KanE [Flavobacterium sp. TAB 87]
MKRIIRFLRNFFVGGFFLMFFYFFQKQKIRSSTIIFFFPHYHTGGAEKVHSEIAKAVSYQKCCVIFTKGSATKSMLPFYSKYATIVELNPILSKRFFCVNKLLKKIIEEQMNTSSSLKTVLGANSDYFYELLPFLNNNFKKIDLFHAFRENDDRESTVVASALLIDSRIVINKKAKEIISNYYLKANQSFLLERVQIISNGVTLPKITHPKNSESLNISFIGRWSAEKRPELYLQAAKLLKEKFKGLTFFIAGSGTIPNQKQIESHNVVCLGDIHEKKILDDLYSATHLLVLTSVYEGFPMVFMEGMSYGCVPISTNVGGISEHIQHGVNGFLINETVELKIIDNLIQTISHIYNDRSLLEIISNNCNKYAHANFSIKKFNNSYQQLLK